MQLNDYITLIIALCVGTGVLSLSYRIRGGLLSYWFKDIPNWPERLQWGLATAAVALGAFWYSYGFVSLWHWVGGIAVGILFFLSNMTSHGFYYTMNRIPRAQRPNQTDWLAAFTFTYPKLYRLKEDVKGPFFELKKGWHVAWVTQRVKVLDNITNEYWRDFGGMAILGFIRGLPAIVVGLWWVPFITAITHPVAYSLRGPNKNTQMGEWVYGASVGFLLTTGIILPPLINYYLTS